ncbi:GAF domain-containing protein [Candidatus Leptofilum sp.]|uniref:GAF domain-containing protein n=1 Tax=Candidatus Leptofilum sp. TaxID=3241576 RepID=UPI003B5B35D6
MNIKQFFGRRFSSIRAQLRLGMGIIFFVLILVTFLNILVLLNIRSTLGVDINDANQLQVLSNQMQSEFLLARQNEANILTTWRSVGFSEAASNNLEENATHLLGARNALDQIDRIFAANDTFQGSAQLVEQTAEIRPLITDYETTFQSTIEAIELRSQAEGLERSLQVEFDSLDDMVRPLNNPELESILRQIRTRERTYFITGQQEHVDSIRLLITSFQNVAEETQTVEEAATINTQVDSYFTVANDLFDLDQQIRRSNFVFEEITSELQQAATELQGLSEVVVEDVRTNLQIISRDILRIIAAISVITILVGSAAAFYLIRQINHPLQTLGNAVREMSQGNLNQRVTIERPVEIAGLADGFNGMATQLQTLVDTLEEQVANRTVAIETSALVGRQISTILDEAELVKAVVEQVQNAFNYYHVHIYLLDSEANTLLMAGGTGEAGQTMLSHGHRIPVGKGLVGRAAQTNMDVLVPDVSQDEQWLANPLLPETKAETAVPIAIGDNVLGVLDVQHNVVNGLDQGDVDLLHSLSSQIAVALRNARDYATTQARVEQEARLNDINHQIDTAQSVEEVMQIAVRELGQVLGAEKTAIRLLENGRHTTITQS